MLSLLVATLALASDAEFGAIVSMSAEVDTANDRDGLSLEHSGEDLATVHTWARLFAHGSLRERSRWFAEARFQHHALLAPDKQLSHDAEGWWAFQLGESGIDVALADKGARLRAGALVERWGTLELLPAIDVLNPIDARSGLATPQGWAQLPRPMATLSFEKGIFRSETTVLPFPAQHRIWLRETDWSLIRQGMAEGALRDALTWQSDTPADTFDRIAQGAALAQRDLDPTFRRGQDAATNTKGSPQPALLNGEIAQRFEFNTPGGDFAIMGGALRNTFPLPALDPTVAQLLQDRVKPDESVLADELQPVLTSQNALALSWPRTAMVGLDGSVVVGDLQLRAEGGWWSDYAVRRAYGQGIALARAAGGAGIDYIRDATFQATAEARIQHLFDAPDDLVLAAQTHVQVAAGVRTAIFAERLTAEFGGMFDLTFEEWTARPSVRWRASDHWELEAFAVLLGGATDAPETFEEALTYTGGPASYWSQNDSINVGFHWYL